MPEAELAHRNDKMACYTCHTSWTTSCAGCHLPIEANWKTERHHYEGGETRNYATYNPQVARDDMFQLGLARHRQGQQDRARSLELGARAVIDQHQPRAHLRAAAAGLGRRLIRARPSRRTTRTPSGAPRPRPAPIATSRRQNDNNAIMAQLLLLGTNFVNFVGYNAWVGEAGRHRGGTRHRVGRAAGGDRQLSARIRLSRLVHGASSATADELQRGRTARQLGVAQLPAAARRVSVRRRGHSAACASTTSPSIANKDVSERIITAPFSPLGQDTHIASADATCVALPTNQPINPLRNAGRTRRSRQFAESCARTTKSSRCIRSTLRLHHRRDARG